VKHTDMKQQNLFENIEPHKLHRENDPQTSREAAYTMNISKARAFVLNLIEEAGNKGTTTREMTRKFPEKSDSSITSRPNELEKLNLIFYKGDKRDGSRVIRHIKYKESISNETN